MKAWRQILSWEIEPSVKVWEAGPRETYYFDFINMTYYCQGGLHPKNPEPRKLIRAGDGTWHNQALDGSDVLAWTPGGNRGVERLYQEWLRGE